MECKRRLHAVGANRRDDSVPGVVSAREARADVNFSR